MEKLQQFLATSGIRQSALASKLGINRGYMSQLASGRKLPSLQLAAEIEKVTDGAVPVGCWIPPSGIQPLDPTPDEDAA